MERKSKKNNIVQIKRTKEAKQYPLSVPQKAGDVGFDLVVVQDVIVPAHAERPTDIPTGVSIKLPEGYWAMVINRSSTARKHGIDVVNGVIDNGYTGELFACCWNRNREDILVRAGTRLAQFVVMTAYVPTLMEVNELPKTERGATGFGSTDSK